MSTASLHRCKCTEVLLGKPLFPGRNVVHQLELITDLLGTPPPEVIAKVSQLVQGGVGVAGGGVGQHTGAAASCLAPCCTWSG